MTEPTPIVVVVHPVGTWPPWSVVDDTATEETPDGTGEPK